MTAILTLSVRLASGAEKTIATQLILGSRLEMTAVNFKEGLACSRNDLTHARVFFAFVALIDSFTSTPRNILSK